MRRILTVLACISGLFQSVSYCNAQKRELQNIDSLKQVLNSVHNDSDRIKIMSMLAHFYFTVDPETGLHYGKEALKTSNRMGWEKGKALALIAIGSNYWAKDDFTKAQDYYWE